MTIDFDFAEHRTAIIISGCIAVIAASLATGGADRWQTQQATRQADQAGKAAQTRAEAIYQDQGCIAQAISGSTRTSNFAVGDTAVDPMSITTANPGGSPIAGGYVCSTDGSIFRVEAGVIAELIGTSPKIRDALIAGGFAQEAQMMQQRAQVIYNLTGGQ
jgi:type II secretory pathway pseudopilin PulG